MDSEVVRDGGSTMAYRRPLGCMQRVLGTELLLSSRERMTLVVGAIFWFISHTMPCQPKGLGLHIYSWPRQPSICQDASLRCCPNMLSSKMMSF
jgi:hypothetical protein